MPKYDFKLLAEALWFALVAVAVVMLQALIQFDPAEIKQWDTWIITLAAASVRAAAGALLAAFTKPV